MTDNTVTIAATLLTREPELRFTPNGQATATFGIAVNRTWTDRQNQERKERPLSSTSSPGAAWPRTPPPRWPKSPGWS